MTRLACLSLALVATLARGGVAVRAQAPTGPTFDCTRAAGKVETLICTDEALATLDRRLADVYAKAIAGSPANVAATQKALQRGWIKGRDDCWKSAETKTCVQREYRSRIAELQIVSGQVEGLSPVSFRCSGAPAAPVTATFYNETDPASTVLTVGTDQVIAFRQPAASGTSYAGSNVDYREHQGAVTINWFGATLACTRR
ncbi:Membrane-bound lysozyme-inhibitor of c-type lysozyme [Luteitalea pratensis]|uniref:Membrane-bound lysozyme-inhibitor of c-type lysozyme n=1 Tax=Luteitalea pratensis TaxID=1855912 RepID=A0A143PJK1_LUTPR|nr:MliC family protein [Luteitalea pratensis]AMY08745.1 Membrane-bound lysozyme-inhibitor of c-type lysozyme [Luteitalea pratensis]